MSKTRGLIISRTVTENIPTAVQNKLAEMPEAAQREFAYEFRKNMKTTPITYLLHFLFGASYAYLGNWGLQILFWLSWFTLLGGAIWSVILLFTIPEMTNQANMEAAKRALRTVMIKYGYTKKTSKQVIAPADPIRSIKPRSLKRADYDPSQLTVDNLKAGYMLDYDVKSWKVNTENQYDWESGFSEKSFILTQNVEKLHLFLNNAHGNQVVMVAQPVNIYAIEATLEDEILKEKRPRNILEFEEMTYYRENTKEGLKFDIVNNTNGNKLITWEYYDKDRTKVIRIEQYGRSSFKAYVGRLTSIYDFSQILPGDMN